MWRPWAWFSRFGECVSSGQSMVLSVNLLRLGPRGVLREPFSEHVGSVNMWFLHSLQEEKEFSPVGGRTGDATSSLRMAMRYANRSELPTSRPMTVYRPALRRATVASDRRMKDSFVVLVWSSSLVTAALACWVGSLVMRASSPLMGLP